MSFGEFPRFRLYIMGESPAGKRALASFHKIAPALFQDKASLEVVDILLKPDMAEQDHILAVPTLVRLSPMPIVKIIGDLTDAAKLRAFLGG